MEPKKQCSVCGHKYTPRSHKKVCKLLSDQNAPVKIISDVFREIDKESGLDEYRGHTIAAKIDVILDETDLICIEEADLDEFRATLSTPVLKQYDIFKKTATPQTIICVIVLESGPDEYCSNICVI